MDTKRWITGNELVTVYEITPFEIYQAIQSGLKAYDQTGAPVSLEAFSTAPRLGAGGGAFALILEARRLTRFILEAEAAVKDGASVDPDFLAAKDRIPGWRFQTEDLGEHFPQLQGLAPARPPQGQLEESTPPVTLEELMGVKRPRQKGSDVKKYHGALSRDREGQANKEIVEHFFPNGQRDKTARRTVERYLEKGRELEARALARRSQ